MRVHIENDLYLSADGRQYTLERRTVTQSGDNAGESKYNGIGYYASLQGVINAIVKLKITDSTATTLKELLASVEGIRAEVETLIRV